MDVHLLGGVSDGWVFLRIAEMQTDNRRTWSSADIVESELSDARVELEEER